MMIREAQGPNLDLAVATAEKLSWWTRRNADWNSNRGYTDWILDTDGVLKKFYFDGSRSRSGFWAEQAVYKPSTHWEVGGPLIDREKIVFSRHNRRSQDGRDVDVYLASLQPVFTFQNYTSTMARAVTTEGPTHLIAAMRCIAVYKLGESFTPPEQGSTSS